ncbi:MAG: hypothetical protein RLY31_2561 [Bacteroidota bacterium]|jgi:DNA ligase-associated metallophosphoesterase
MDTRPVSFAGEHLLLHPDRALYWPVRQTLLLSDLHIGKSGHFRKAGIPIPAQVQADDLDRLSGLIRDFLPRRVAIVGDLFHAGINQDMEQFRTWRMQLPALSFVLVRGNHDRLSEATYRDLGIDLVCEQLSEGPFDLVHQPVPRTSVARHTISGHLHPGVAVRTRDRQTLRLPCFWLSGYCLTLPAFSRFTGLYLVEPGPADQVFAIAEDTILPLHG